MNSSEAKVYAKLTGKVPLGTKVRNTWDYGNPHSVEGVVIGVHENGFDIRITKPCSCGLPTCNAKEGFLPVYPGETVEIL